MATQPTLSTVEPYEPEEFKALESTYTAPSASVGASYVEPEIYTPEESELVSGQLTGLLASGSPYIEAATEKGKRTAQARGLLNTSLAAEASQKAAIESALPIAQQDSSVYTTAGLQAQEGRTQGALSAQDYENQASLTSLQGDISSRLSAQEAAAAGNLAQYNAAISAGLSAQEAEQISGISAQEAEQASTLSGQEAAQKLTQTETEASLTAELTQQEAAYSQYIQGMGDKAANTRQAAELETSKTIAAMNLTSEETVSFGAAATLYGDTYIQSIAAIQSDPELSGSSKTEIITGLEATYKANMNSISSIYGAEIEWV